MSGVSVEFCGETVAVPPTRPLLIGREGDLVVDDNPYLHRHFLSVERIGEMWWLVNRGSRLTATVADETGLMHAWLSPGASLPLVFPVTKVWFTAGPTTYELAVHQAEATFLPAPREAEPTGGTTYGRTALTPDQKLLILVLAEQTLRRGVEGVTRIPSNAEAAASLGWTITKFNRKLDNVCQRLVRHGVRGLHGGPGQLAATRRARLVEYAVASRIVSVDDLPVLEHAREVARQPQGEPVT